MQAEYLINQQIIQSMQYGYQTTFQPILQPITLKAQSLTVDLPLYDYNTTKLALVPFDKKTFANGVFTCLDDAMKYIGRHSKKYHGQFNRQLAKSYAPYCRILDFVSGDYYSLCDVSKRDFNSAFQRVLKDLE